MIKIFISLKHNSCLPFKILSFFLHVAFPNFQILYLHKDLKQYSLFAIYLKMKQTFHLGHIKQEDMLA